jgi:hypothetical protein
MGGSAPGRAAGVACLGACCATAGADTSAEKTSAARAARIRVAIGIVRDLREIRRPRERWAVVVETWAPGT